MKVIVAALIAIALSVGGFVLLWFLLAPADRPQDGLDKLGCHPATVEHTDAGVLVVHCQSRFEDAALPSCDELVRIVRPRLGGAARARVVVEAADTVRCTEDVAREGR